MVKGRLPEERQLRLGSVTLPAGRLIFGNYGSGDPIAWATVQPVPEPGRVWAALSELHPHTGLVPILLDGLDGDTRRPWDNAEFTDPVDITALDALDAGTVLETMWTDSLGTLHGGEQEHPDIIRQRAPFTSLFPGPAPPEQTPLDPAQLQEALDSLRQSARIALVATDRPADVLPEIGWQGVTNRYEFLLPIAAVLRSWEDRFGARLLEVGFAEIRLLVERPPHNLKAAERIAAEHYAFCDESGGGLRDIRSIAASLVNSPIWAFWWD
jgi:Domain of unknown function (DUF4253)